MTEEQLKEIEDGAHSLCLRTREHCFDGKKFISHDIPELIAEVRRLQSVEQCQESWLERQNKENQSLRKLLREARDLIQPPAGPQSHLCSEGPALGTVMRIDAALGDK